MMLLYHHPKNKKAAPESVSSTMLKHTTGVDLDTLWGMTFPNLTAMAHCTWYRSLGLTSRYRKSYGECRPWINLSSRRNKGVSFLSPNQLGTVADEQ